MTTSSRADRCSRRRAAAVGLLAMLALASCQKAPTDRYQGYLEGEFVYVGAPLAGRLETLAVAKGARIAAATPLFTLEREAELATQRQATEQLRAAEARLADLRLGARPSELAALEARLGQAQAAAELARLELARVETLFRTRVVAENDFDRARLAHEQAAHTVDDLTAQAATARLGARSDALAAAAADVAALTAALARAEWSVAQKSQAAPADALVYDTLFRAGEFVATGQPIVALLPAQNVKVRFYVPEAVFATLRAGQSIHVALSGRPPLPAKISYLSPTPEYTLPVLYNRENRAKLVFQVEAAFDAAAAADLHPGQPVDVSLAP